MKGVSSQGYIFDLDGTLYDFGGLRFSDSPLGERVKMGFYRIIKEHSLGDPSQVYENMVAIEKQEKIGTSQQLAHRTGQTREELLAQIWGSIDPKGVIKNFDIPKRVIEILNGRGSPLFVVTAAPRVWANTALQYMQVKQYFDIILTLEDYRTSKAEAFSEISDLKNIPFQKLISIGDQEYSDILPARELGMQTLLVTSPGELQQLL